MSSKSKLVQLERGTKKIAGKKKLRFKSGDVLQIPEGVDGAGIRTFNTVSTVHGPSTLVVAKSYLEQKSGAAIHNAKEGKLIVPGLTIDHKGASYLVSIEEKTIDIIVFNGEILVTSTVANPKWKPFFVKDRQQRKIWRDGRLAPNRPLRPDDLNRWIATENQLLRAGGDKNRMVPSVITLPSEDAKGLIAAAQFPVTLDFTQEGDGELGTISKQEPRAGQRVKSDKQVVIYERSRPVVVPDVYGLSLGAAQKKLENVGLKGHDAGKTITRGVEPGMVNLQKPAAGKTAGEGSSIALNIEAVAVKVPDLRGLSIADANAALKGLKLETESTNYDLDYNGTPQVVGQTPSVDNYAVAGSVVKVIVQQKGYKVPNLVGLTPNAATKKIEDANLAVGKIKEKKSDKIAKGLIVSQNPVAGLARGKGTKVELTISKGK
ncbi:MAG: PASTA domain-containing protein [Saprospiraceae bacterium]